MGILMRDRASRARRSLAQVLHRCGTQTVPYPLVRTLGGGYPLTATARGEMVVFIIFATASGILIWAWFTRQK